MIVVHRSCLSNDFLPELLLSVLLHPTSILKFLTYLTHSVVTLLLHLVLVLGIVLEPAEEVLTRCRRCHRTCEPYQSRIRISYSKYIGDPEVHYLSRSRC